jgi:aminodeoxyfutalosine deaminase
MEGSLAPPTVVELAARYGARVTEQEVTAAYRVSDFAGFIETYKWVTSYLRAPGDYALAAERLAALLLAENVVYGEITLSVGVMLLRKQDVAANFRAIREAVASFEKRGLRLQWIFDTVRQFGGAAAKEVARRAIELRREGVVAFGMGGDELSLPTSEFRDAYNQAAASGLHRVAHAGEIGGPELVREAVEQLGAERIGHGIAAVRDPYLMNWLANRAITLEICPSSNVRTGALGLQLGRTAFPTANDALVREASNDDAPAREASNDDASAREAPVAAPHRLGETPHLIALRNHPLPQLLRSGIPVTLSTDDPAMFETSLVAEYATLGEMGLTAAEILGIAEAGFSCAFLTPTEKQQLLANLRQGAAALSLL